MKHGKMRFQNVTKRFQHIISDYRPDHAFVGVVKDFDTVHPVPSKPTIDGMNVETKRGTIYVHFNLMERPPLEVGEEVYILGTDKHLPRVSWTTAVAVFSPQNKWVLFPKELQIRFTCPFLSWIAFGVICFILYQISKPINYLLAQALFIVSSIVILLSYCLFQYLRRSQIIYCDPKSWDSIIAEFQSIFDLDVLE